MTGPLIAPVIPPSGRLAVRGRGAMGPGRRLPLAAGPGFPADVEGVLYGFGRIDASGRVADRAIISVLGWRAGDRLRFSAAGAWWSPGVTGTAW